MGGGRGWVEDKDEEEERVGEEEERICKTDISSDGKEISKKYPRTL